MGFCPRSSEQRVFFMSAEIVVEQPVLEEIAMPTVFTVPETTAETVAVRRAARFIGSVALGEEVEGPTIEKPLESLHEAIQEAAGGDPTARELIKINAKTTGVEQAIKTGHVGTKVPLFVSSHGEIFQHRQSFSAVHANGLRVSAEDPVMSPRAEAEARNKFRLEALNEQGYFDEGYSLVVFSLAENHPEFFTETMTCSIQVTSKNEEGFTTEPAFVSGIAEPGGEQHDMQTVVKLYATLGVDISGKTPAEIIDTPLLIHNSLMPNGAIDVVKWWDDCAGGTFFGENKPRSDYLEYLETCAEREKRFEPKAEKVTDQLISEHLFIHTPLMAAKRLHKLSEEQMVEQAIGDTDIDPRVFGPAAPYIERARIAYLQGAVEQLIENIRMAKSTARTVSCPGSGFNSDSLDPFSDESTQDTSDCEYVSKECPKCGRKNVKTTETATAIRGDCGCSASK